MNHGGKLRIWYYFIRGILLTYGSMISDFFFPNMGGVENHIYYLSQCLRKRGHKVIVVTHAYGPDYTGIKWIEDGLKVYYLPIPILYNQCSYPLFYLNFSYLYSIFIREGINYVHGHQAFSSLCHEGLFHARTMNIPCSFTDHSLFGFADVSSVLTNKMLKFTLSGVDNVICVSYTSKENTVLRAALSSDKVNVIPNAVFTSHFIPASEGQDKDGYITIIILCRLVYRKGVDLLTAVIPRVCKAHKKVKFLIAGDGPKKIDLEQMRDEHLLHDRVELIGAVPAKEARNVLVRGQIFLNTSLTEAFCMAITEAASCGLLVVSTKVGGIPEVLPSHMMLLCEPDSNHLTESILRAVEMIENNLIDTSNFHSELCEMYSWENVAQRTETVYYSALQERKDGSLIARLADYYGCGEVLGKIACCMVIVDFILLVFLRYLLNPIDLAEDEEAN